MDTEIHFSNIVHTLQIVGCHFGAKPEGWSYPRHHHYLFELLYCWDGEAILTVEEKEIAFAAGELMVLRPGVRHGARNNSPDTYTYFNVHFNTDDMELRSLLTSSSYKFLPQTIIRQSRIPVYIKEIEALMQKELTDPHNYQWLGNQGFLPLQTTHKLILQSHILLILKEFVSLLDASGHEPEKSLPQTYALQVNVAHAIESRLQSMIFSKAVIADIAKEQNLSRSQCSKIFTQVYGMSPRQYLSELKLNQAKKFLLSSELTVETISEELGFASVSHFSRQFRRWTGVSPIQFRPKH